MSSVIQRLRVRSHARVGYVFLAPALLALSVYLVLFLGLNSRRGAEMLAGLLSDQLAGTLDYGYLSVGPDLRRVDLWAAEIRDPTGRPVIQVRHLGCSFNPLPLLQRQLLFHNCDGSDGRILIEQQENGRIGLVRAFQPDFLRKRRHRNPMLFAFEGINLRRVDLLISTRDMLFLFEKMDLTDGNVVVDGPFPDLHADLAIPSGRMLFSERIFSLGTGKSTHAEADFELLRLQRPWAAARTPQPDGGRGMLELPIVGGEIRGFHWVRENFRLDHVRLRSLDNLIALEANGLFGLMPTRPKQPLDSDGGMRFDGRLTLSAHPDSPLFDWFFPTLFDPPSRSPGRSPAIEPLVLDAWGNLQFANVRPTRLRLRDVTLMRWAIDEADLGITLNNGRAELASDSTIRAFGGQIRGGGSFVPRTGVWDLQLCISELGLLDAVLPWSPSLTEPLRGLVDLRLSTGLSDCDAEEPSGIALSGDLTRKALEIDPAASTPDGKPIQPPMIALSAPGLVLRWASPPPLLPFALARVTLNGVLDQRGRLVAGSPAEPGLVVRLGEDRLSFGGVLDLATGQLEPSRLSVESSGLDRWAASLADIELPSGFDLNAQLDLDGPVAAPRLSRVDVTVQRADASGIWPAFAAELRGRVEGDVLAADRLSVRTPVGELDAAGRIGLFDGSVLRLRNNATIDLEFDLRNLRPGFWSQIVGDDATIDASGSVSGSLADPALRADRVTLSDLLVGDEPLEQIDAVDVLLTNRGVGVGSFELNKGEGRATGHFAWDMPTDVVQGALVVRDVNLRDLRTVAALGVPLRGDARVDLQIGGTLSSPDVEGAVILTGLEIERRRLGQAVFAIDTWEDFVRIHGSIGTQLAARLRLPLAAAGRAPIALEVDFERLALERYWPAFARSVQRSSFSGTVRAELDPQTRGARADLVLNDVLVRVGTRDFGVPRPVRASWTAEPDDGRLAQTVRIHELTTAVEGRELTLRGMMVLDPLDPRLSLSLGGDLDFSLLRLLPDLIVDAEGVADVSLKVFGPLDAPAIDGEAIFGPARIAPRGLGTSVLLDPGQLRIETGRLVIDEAAPITGTLFGGDLSLYGEVGLAGVVPDSARIQAFVTNLSYRVPESFQVTLTGPVSWEAAKISNFDTWAVAGDLTLVDGRFVQDFDIISDQFAFGGIGRGVEQFALPIWLRVPAVGRMTSDITVSGRDRFYVESRIAGAELDLEFRTELAVTGRFEAMDVQGEMEALEGGTVQFQGRTFEATNFLLAFRGDRSETGIPMPSIEAELTASILPCSQTQRGGLAQLDASAVSDSNRVFITAWLDGLLPYGLNFRLESTPFYDQRDQLSLILTGCTVDALTGGSGGAPTLDAVLRPLLNVVERNVEQRLALDQVDVAPTADGTAGLQIQDELTERFRWTLDAIFGTSETQRQIARGEYRLFDWLVLEVQEQTSADEPVRIDAGMRFRLVLQ